MLNLVYLKWPFINLSTYPWKLWPTAVSHYDTAQGVTVVSRIWTFTLKNWIKVLDQLQVIELLLYTQYDMLTASVVLSALFLILHWERLLFVYCLYLAKVFKTLYFILFCIISLCQLFTKPLHMYPMLLESLFNNLHLDLHTKLTTQFNLKQDHLFTLNFKLKHSGPLTCMNKHST